MNWILFIVCSSSLPLLFANPVAQWTFTDRSASRNDEHEFKGRPTRCLRQTTKLFVVPAMPGKVSIQLFSMTPGYLPSFYVYSKKGSGYDRKKWKRDNDGEYFKLDNNKKQYLIEVGISEKIASRPEFKGKPEQGEFILLVTNGMKPIWCHYASRSYQPCICTPRTHEPMPSVVDLKFWGTWCFRLHGKWHTIGRADYKLPMYFKPDYGIVGVHYVNSDSKDNSKGRMSGLLGITHKRSEQSHSYAVEACACYFEGIVFDDEIKELVDALMAALQKDGHPKQFSTNQPQPSAWQPGGSFNLKNVGGEFLPYPTEYHQQPSVNPFYNPSQPQPGNVNQYPQPGNVNQYPQSGNINQLAYPPQQQPRGPTPPQFDNTNQLSHPPKQPPQKPPQQQHQFPTPPHYPNLPDFHNNPFEQFQLNNSHGHPPSNQNQRKGSHSKPFHWGLDEQQLHVGVNIPIGRVEDIFEQGKEIRDDLKHFRGAIRHLARDVFHQR